MPKLNLFLIPTILFILLSCGNEVNEINSIENNKNLLNTISPEQYQKLQNKKIYWGHQSVGWNIVNGIKDIMKENSRLQLNIIEKDELKNKNKPFFAHSNIGQNTIPKSKVDDFVQIIDSQFSKVDIAFLKFCYVDITKDSNVDEIFMYYKKSMDRLLKKYPKIKFVHITVPLTSATEKKFGLKTKIKDIIKNFIGRKTTKQIYIEYNNISNINRFKYNELLIKEYGGHNVFDLAKYESTTLNGERQTFTQNGNKYYELVNAYTSDGGHLNESGRKIIANQLIIFLTSL